MAKKVIGKKNIISLELRKSIHSYFINIIILGDFSFYAWKNYLIHSIKIREVFLHPIRMGFFFANFVFKSFFSNFF